MVGGRWLNGVMVLVTVLASACAFESDPAARVQVMQTPSGLEFLRGSRLYEHGAFVGGLRDAVSGVPRAEEQAEAHSRLLMGGFLLELAGLVLAGATVVTAAQSDESGDGLDTTLALASGAVVFSVASSALYAHSTPYVWDAVNSYNDEVQRAAADQRGGPVPAEGTSMLQPVP
ncbi:MAG TPA: hypothetical protein VNN80_12925 [Polyangiaceae bacterium]|nr:hypothetical protein [Polyangiaceae bacterium]